MPEGDKIEPHTKRNSMAKKYYAVRNGRTRGIYLTWEDCRKNVEGYENAVYKGFSNIEEAEKFLEGETPGQDSVHSSEKAANRDGSANAAHENNAHGDRNAVVPTADDGDAVAYVDGSYNIATGAFGCGVVLLYAGQTKEMAKAFSDPERAKMRNVAGEIEGSMCAMQYCLDHKIDRLTICYDYAGIEYWCTGAWKANKEGTMAYRDFYRKASERLSVTFEKVKGHSGDYYNDWADRLAKRSVGIEEGERSERVDQSLS